MGLEDLDLNIENYSIKEIKNLLNLDDEYTTDEVHESIDNLIRKVEESDTIIIKEKKRIVDFFNSMRVIIIKYINQETSIDTGITIRGEQLQEREDYQPYKEYENTKYPLQERDPKELEVQDYNLVKYKRDTLNPLKQETIMRCVTFDTRFRDDYFKTMSTDYRVILPDKLTNVVSMQLSSLELPTSFFVINEGAGNNFFSYQVIKINQENVVKTVKIPSGNYSHTDLLSQINNAIINNGDLINFSVDITGLGSGTGKTIIQNNTVSELIHIYFDRNDLGFPDDTPIPLKFGWILGFRNNEYIGNTTYVSEGMYEDHGSRYLYLAVNDHNNNTQDTYLSVFNSSTLNRNILARISLKTPAFHILNETGLNLVTLPRKYMGPVSITTLNIQVLDEFGRIVNINNMDYSFSLNIESLYN